MVANTAKALPSLLQGDVARFNEIAGPVALKNLAKGVEMYLTGEYRDMQGRKVREVTAADAAIKAVGFQPAEVAQDSRKVRMAAQQVGLARNIEAEIANQWAQALADNKPEQVQKARQRLAEWNASNPESRIVITLPQIVRRVREIKASRDERFIKRAPKEMRASVEGIVQ